MILENCQKRHHTSGRPWTTVMSRLVQRGALLRAGRGIHVLPVESRFGSRVPSTAKMVEGMAETTVSHGAFAANALGLISQVSMRAVYLTSGSSRRLKLGRRPSSSGMRRCSN